LVPPNPITPSLPCSLRHVRNGVSGFSALHPPPPHTVTGDNFQDPPPTPQHAFRPPPQPQHTLSLEQQLPCSPPKPTTTPSLPPPPPPP
ncbi:hypothetical protein T484DRAFT_1569722, partial [Baffinella frigidus]